MKRIFLTAALILSYIGSVAAQDEYRIMQEIPDSVNEVTIPDGCVVKLMHADQSSVTIVTPCTVFFDDDRDINLFVRDGKKLELQENKNMAKSTVIEIALKSKVKKLYIKKKATVKTYQLKLADYSWIEIEEGAKVQGDSWISKGDINVYMDPDSELKLDTLKAEKNVWVKCPYGARFECPTMTGQESYIKKDVKSFGTDFQSDSSRNLTVKKVNRRWTRYFDELTISGGISSPIPLYMNNKSGSAYNRGENYRINMNMGVTSWIPLGKRLSFRPTLQYEVNWDRLLNSVTTDGNQLTLSTPTSGEIPQQHLLGQNFGLKMSFYYPIGRKDEKSGKYPLSLSFNMTAMYNVGGDLITRTMGSDNRWIKTKEKADVFNPWQLRASLGVNFGPLINGGIELYYDLLPTFKSGIGADKVHTFGIGINF